jgi:RimJ/RimL family protein N-acetyltransferase
MSDVFAKYARATREAFAQGLGCAVEDFNGEQLTIVDRPPQMTWSTLVGATFGTGTVLQLDPAYRDWAEANRPERHYRALSTSFLGELAAEGARRGHTLQSYTPSLCFALAREPQAPSLSAGYQVRRHDAAWMLAEQPNRRFENGVGEPGRDGREFRNRFALAIYDAAGEPIAVAGAFDTHGMLEIGVDVLRGQRGAGLGRTIVTLMTQAILDERRVPFYACAPANIRSHRTAESCGFRIVCADAFVSAPL